MQVATIHAGDQSVPVPCYLIQLNDGTNILVDSGFPSDIQSDDEMQITVEQDVIAHLAAIGLRPDDISIVICTHLDPDHAGQHHAFARATFVLQREHDTLARGGDPRFEVALPIWNLPASRFQLVDGDTTLLPGLDLIASSGHTPGHQSILVRLPQTGPVLLAIDALPFDMTPFTPENRPVNDYDMDHAATRASTRKLLDLYDMDHAATRASTRKLLDLAAREHASLIVYGHDDPQWRILKTAPAYYD
jgi:N-acyl homoserine lactone hydrolase